MCGIVGYSGKRQASLVLLEGLRKLEYRGYDSAGMAVLGDDGKTRIVKAKGRLKVLSEKTLGGETLPGHTGIGHTRWATHGEPSENNAHPHFSDDNNVVAVHNGIIDNYVELKEKLLGKGYKFYSETDTEVVTKLVDYYYKKYNIGPIDAIAKTMVRVRGSYALAVMFHDCPGEIYVARKDSPLVLGKGEGESFVASDVPAILKYTREVYYLGNLEMARIKDGDITFFNLNGDTFQKESTSITWDAEDAEKGGWEHFMIKEIHEEPKAVQDTVSSLVKDGRIDLSASGLTKEIEKDIEALRIVACGSSFHVGEAVKPLFNDLSRIPVTVEYASEYRYRKPVFHKNEAVVFISQSGETADTREAMRMTKEEGVRTIAVVNVLGSSIAREADHVIYTMAGPEIAVATTKAYSAQLVAMYALGISIASSKEMISEEEERHLVEALGALPGKIEKILDEKERIQWFASKFSSAKDVFFIGRGIDWAISMEGSLKLKEISYIHSEAYAAGELKHGTISLLEEGTLVVGVLTGDDLLEKTLSNLTECRARGAYIMSLTTYGHYGVEDSSDFTVYVPRTEKYFTPSLAIVPLQLFSYYISVSKGLDVDKPRNLAKSVTVE
ncbi:MAG: glutamine--fructose-6-phosphate transaminase (isomerizing) [Candidatus Ornithospirochaeta sp.]